MRPTPKAFNYRVQYGGYTRGGVLLEKNLKRRVGINRRSHSLVPLFPPPFLEINPLVLKSDRMQVRSAGYVYLAMKLKVNGQDQDLSGIKTAGDLLSHLKIARERVAVIVNENVIRRAELDSTDLNDGDTVEVITMVGGG